MSFNYDVQRQLFFSHLNAIDENATSHAIGILLNGHAEHCHFLCSSIDEPLKISFLREDTPELVDDHKKRYRLSMGRILARHFVEQLCELGITEADCHSFGLQYERHITQLATKVEPKILTGDDLLDIYVRGFARHGGCMSADECHIRKLQVYVHNPKRVAIAIIDHPSLPDARALLWTDDSGQRWLDRIYPNQVDVVKTYRDWAKQNHIFVRSHNSLPKGDTEYIDCDGDIIAPPAMRVSHSGNSWPYIDSFRFVANIDENEFLLCADRESANRSHDELLGHASYAVADETNGSIDGWRQIHHCNNCGEMTEEINYIDNDTYCDNCVAQCPCGTLFPAVEHNAFCERHRDICRICGDDLGVSGTRTTICNSCARHQPGYCSRCRGITDGSSVHIINAGYMRGALTALQTRCESCLQRCAWVQLQREDETLLVTNLVFGTYTEREIWAKYDAGLALQNATT